MRCTICGHDKHEAGKCGKCNCGESEIAHATGERFNFLPETSKQSFFREQHGKIVTPKEQAK